MAVISNLGSFNPDKLSKSVAEVYIGDKMAPQEAKQNAAEPKYVTMDVQELEKFAGVYPLPKVDQTLNVVRERRKIVGGCRTATRTASGCARAISTAKKFRPTWNFRRKSMAACTSK